MGDSDKLEQGMSINIECFSVDGEADRCGELEENDGRNECIKIDIW